MSALTSLQVAAYLFPCLFVSSGKSEYNLCLLDPFFVIFLLVLRDLLLCFTVTYCKSMYIFVNLGAL